MNFVIQQIPIPKNERNLVKSIAQGKSVTLYELIDEILCWFITYANENPSTAILASPKTGEANSYWSFAVYESTLAGIQDLAFKFKSSTNRVLYTAIKMWLHEEAKHNPAITAEIS